MLNNNPFAGPLVGMNASVYTPTTIGSYFPITNPSGVTAPEAVWAFNNVGNWWEDLTANGHDLGLYVRQRECVEIDWGWGFDLNNMITTASGNDNGLQISKIDGGGGDASLTMEFLTNIEGHAVDYQILRCIGGSGSQLQKNILYDLHMGATNWTSRRQTDAAGSHSVTSWNVGYEKNVAEYWAITVNAAGTTSKLYKNGELVDTDTHDAGVRSGTGDTQEVLLGYYYDEPSALYSCRITAAEMNAAQVMAAYTQVLV